MDLRGKTAIITGGGRGIGRAAALDLAREGSNVVISSRNRQELDAVCTEVEGLGGVALGLQLDLSKEENLQALVDRTVDRFGTVDILINNAGIIIPKPFIEVTVDELDETMNINLRSAFILSQKVFKIMMQKRSGYIINISSTVALGVPPQLATYGVSKCGMSGLSQALYEAGKDFGVKVSTVYPGITDTKMVRDIDPPTNPEQWMLPEDISYCILFLLKSSSRMVIKDVVPWSTGYDRV